MKPNRPSTTAEHNAALRAIESLRAEGDRLFTDPYAKFFLSDRLAKAAGSSPFGKQLMTHWEQVSPGVCGAVLVRTRFVDECLEAEIDRGLRQLVVLGAGYDTRALRFQEIKNKVDVFELDHPRRDECQITVGLGDPTAPVAAKRLMVHWGDELRSGAFPFPRYAWVTPTGRPAK